jgi:hypothetical protein
VLFVRFKAIFGNIWPFFYFIRQSAKGWEVHPEFSTIGWGSPLNSCPLLPMAMRPSLHSTNVDLALREIKERNVIKGRRQHCVRRKKKFADSPISKVQYTVRAICYIRALSAHSAAEFNSSPGRGQHVWLVSIVPPKRWGKMDRNDCHTAWGSFKTLISLLHHS